MAINRINWPSSLPTSTADYQAQNNNIIAAFAGKDALPFFGTNMVIGFIMQIGNVAYRVTTATAITGTPSPYVKITPSGDGSTATASFVASLAGVSWNGTHAGYYDVSGNLYLFDEVTAYFSGQIPSLNTAVGGAVYEAFFKQADWVFQSETNGTYSSNPLARRIVILLQGGGGSANQGGGNGGNFVAAINRGPLSGVAFDVRKGSAGASGAGAFGSLITNCGGLAPSGGVPQNVQDPVISSTLLLINSSKGGKGGTGLGGGNGTTGYFGIEGGGGSGGAPNNGGNASGALEGGTNDYATTIGGSKSYVKNRGMSGQGGTSPYSLYGIAFGLIASGDMASGVVGTGGGGGGGLCVHSSTPWTGYEQTPGGNGFLTVFEFK